MKINMNKKSKKFLITFTVLSVIGFVLGIYISRTFIKPLLLNKPEVKVQNDK